MAHSQQSASDHWLHEHLPSDRKRKVTAEEKAERERLCLEAVRAVTDREVAHLREMGRLFYWRGVSAANVAWYIGVKPAHRLGTRASKGNWSGSMPTALRVAPTLQSLYKRGLIGGEYKTADDDYRWRYWPVGEEPWTVM
jgi:hypothetical protein